jgi:hypothetical protein
MDIVSAATKQNGEEGGEDEGEERQSKAQLTGPFKPFLYNQ